MSLTYSDVGERIFGEREFTCPEFARLTGNPRAAKVLSELRLRGIVARRGRGRYKFLRPAERPDLRTGEWERVRSILLAGPGPMAWDGSTAVEVWTRGRYHVEPSLYSKVFHLVVPEGSTTAWESYLRTRGLSITGRKRVGARVEIRETSPFRFTKVDGEPVIARAEVVEMIRSHPGLYAEAESLVIRRP